MHADVCVRYVALDGAHGLDERVCLLFLANETLSTKPRCMCAKRQLCTLVMLKAWQPESLKKGISCCSSPKLLWKSSMRSLSISAALLTRG